MALTKHKHSIIQTQIRRILGGNHRANSTGGKSLTIHSSTVRNSFLKDALYVRLVYSIAR